MKTLNKGIRLTSICFWALLLALVFTQCKGKLENQTSNKMGYSKASLIKCKDDTSQSYYLYLPTTFDDKKVWPVIFIYDPHGSGLLCIESFKEAAERYGYIIAGSNNARNGVGAIDHIINSLTNDVIARYPADRKRIYAAGFSGGGRVALTQALLSENVKGIMIAGAGINQLDFSNLKQKFDIFATAGLGDFNYSEVTSISQQLQGFGWRFIIEEFEGSHAWPPANVINEAVLWFTMNAMRDNVIPIDKSMVKKLMSEKLEDIDVSVSAEHLIEAEHKIVNAIALFNGLKVTKKLEQKLGNIIKSPEYIAEMDRRNSSFGLENELKQGYIDCFSSKDTVWWKAQIDGLNQRIAAGGEIYSHQMYMRVKGFLGIVAYSFTNDIIMRNQMEQAERLIGIYQTLEPLNPDALFFRAIMCDRLNKPAEAVFYMQKSRELGFSDWKKFNDVASVKLKNEMMTSPARK